MNCSSLRDHAAHIALWCSPAHTLRGRARLTREHTYRQTRGLSDLSPSFPFSPRFYPSTTESSTGPKLENFLCTPIFNQPALFSGNYFLSLSFAYYLRRPFFPLPFPPRDSRCNLKFVSCRNHTAPNIIVRSCRASRRSITPAKLTRLRVLPPRSRTVSLFAPDALVFMNFRVSWVENNTEGGANQRSFTTKLLCRVHEFCE